MYKTVDWYYAAFPKHDGPMTTDDTAAVKEFFLDLANVVTFQGLPEVGSKAWTQGVYSNDPERILRCKIKHMGPAGHGCKIVIP